MIKGSTWCQISLDKYITLIQIYMQVESYDHRFYLNYLGKIRKIKSPIPRPPHNMHTTLNAPFPFSSGSLHSTPPYSYLLAIKFKDKL
jgi:hypothetical protein